MGIRTDLAMEAKALWEKSAGKTTKLAGVRARERERDGFAVTDVHILDRRGEAALGKPAGRYVTLELPPLARKILSTGSLKTLKPLILLEFQTSKPRETIPTRQILLYGTVFSMFSRINYSQIC